MGQVITLCQTYMMILEIQVLKLQNKKDFFKSLFYLITSRQLKSPRSRALTNSSAVAKFVAIGIL